MSRWPVSQAATLFIIAVIFALSGASSGEAQWVWDSEIGWIDMAEGPAESERGLYAYARGLLVRGDYAAARDAFQRVENKFPQSDLAGKAKFSRATCEARLGRTIEAGKICAELLGETPAGVDRKTVAAFQLEIIRQAAARHPLESAQMLDLLASRAPSRAIQFEARMEQGLALIRSGDAKAASGLFDAALHVAPDDTARRRALLQAAIADLIAADEPGNGDASIARSAERFKELLYVASRDEPADQVDEYMRLAQAALKEKEPQKRAVFTAAARFLHGGIEAPRADFKKAARRFRGTEAGEAAGFYHAERLLKDGAKWSAFQAYEEFLKEYPASQRRRLAIEREFAIGQDLVEQKRRGKAIIVMEAVARNNPSGPLADDAQMYLGRAHLEAEEFEEAHAAFEAVAEGYPKSEWNSAAVFFCGVSDLRRSRYSCDNETLLGRARAAFERYLRSAPMGVFAGEAKSLLRDCEQRQAEVTSEIIRFYERRRQPKAAAIYREALARDTAAAGGSGGGARP